MRAFIYRWHRRIGITAAFFVMLLAISGLLLNHSDELTLQDISIKSGLLLDWYNIQPRINKSFMARQHWFTQLDQRLYFDQTEIASHVGDLLGVVGSDHGFIVALDVSLLVLTRRGEIVEKVPYSDALPADIRSIGMSAGGGIILVTTGHGYLVDLNSMIWQKTDVPVNLSIATAPPELLYQKVLNAYRGHGLSLERVMLDLHSGRILGNMGVLLVDFMAVLFLLLSISGAWMWYR